jgi:hypothetical protein
MARRLADAFLLYSGAALDLWYRRNAVTLMRRGKGPLATPRCGSSVSGPHISGAAPYLPLRPLITDPCCPSDSSWLGRGGHFGMTAIR